MFGPIVLGVVAGVLFLALLVSAALFLPVVFSLDSETWELRVRCFAALQFWVPLALSGGEPQLCIAGIPARLPQRARKSRPIRETHKRESEHSHRQWDRARLMRFFVRCVADSSVRVPILKNAQLLWRSLRKSAALTRREIQLCLPDPAWNGMLAGALASGRFRRGMAIHVNFAGDNFFFLEARLYPHRAAKALLRFVGGLPYRALWREWRASAGAA